MKKANVGEGLQWGSCSGLKFPKGFQDNFGRLKKPFKFSVLLFYWFASKYDMLKRWRDAWLGLRVVAGGCFFL